MSAKTKPKNTPNKHHYAFLLPGGQLVGRYSFHGPLEATIPLRGIRYSAEGIAAKREEILTLFPNAKIIPAPFYNPESKEWETPRNVPNLN